MKKLYYVTTKDKYSFDLELQQHKEDIASVVA
jgi:hypothetical protein